MYLDYRFFILTKEKRMFLGGEEKREGGNGNCLGCQVTVFLAGQERREKLQPTELVLKRKERKGIPLLDDSTKKT